jgi:hypothetical protein
MMSTTSRRVNLMGSDRREDDEIRGVALQALIPLYGVYGVTNEIKVNEDLTAGTHGRRPSATCP